MKKYLAKLKGRVLQRKTQRCEWIIRETIRQKLLVKYFPGVFYGPNRDGPCEWLGSKKDMTQLDSMEELVYFAHKVQNPKAPAVLSETSESEREDGGLTVLKDRSAELNCRKRVLTRDERDSFPARCVAVERVGAANMNL